MTFGEFWPLYYRKKEGYVKRTTLAAYSLIWSHHLAEYFSQIEIDQVRNSTLQRYVDNKLSNGCKSHSIKDQIVVVKNMIKYWCLDQDKPIVAYTIIWPTKSSQSLIKREKYSDKEINKLLEYTKKSTSHLDKMIALAASTGLRIGELCGLKFGDFDYSDSSIDIRRTVGRTYFGSGNTELYVNIPKCGSSERTIPIPSWLNRYFRDYQKLFGLDGDDYISATITKGTPFLEPRTLRSNFRVLCNKVDIPYKSFHSLRHSYASRLLQAKVDVRTTAELLGHSDVQTTLNIYAHSDDATKRSAAKKIFI